MIEKREKRKKIFYVPGMISLVFIPLFCFYHFYKTDAFKVYRSVDLSFPDSIQKKGFLAIKRNYQLFYLNRSEDSEKKELNELQLALRKIKQKNDTINGIQIHLGNKMQYEVYVRVLDILAIEQMPFFIQNDNDFLVLIMPKPKSRNHFREIVPFQCGYWEANKDFFLEEERKRQFEYYLSLYKKNWVLLLAYFGLVFLNIFALVKFNKSR
ncbi:hypothetical protein [Flavobacterium pectinovorum]|uniref:Uncharacterized protein n=1 Tax=Flavobacterium pectinovorum TaxID=29533 RepID=A0A502EL78_9FLAO|nr:hypothetical protein [Flavobacterium pectinovorum]TPG37829.1 hypothetical protein EAH81_18030 [Flavobacterium pectinovorum]